MNTYSTPPMSIDDHQLAIGEICNNFAAGMLHEDDAISTLMQHADTLTRLAQANPGRIGRAMYELATIAHDSIEDIQPGYFDRT